MSSYFMLLMLYMLHLGNVKSKIILDILWGILASTVYLYNIRELTFYISLYILRFSHLYIDSFSLLFSFVSLLLLFPNLCCSMLPLHSFIVIVTKHKILKLLLSLSSSHSFIARYVFPGVFDITNKGNFKRWKLELIKFDYQGIFTTEWYYKFLCWSGELWPLYFVDDLLKKLTRRFEEEQHTWSSSW